MEKEWKDEYYENFQQWLRDNVTAWYLLKQEQEERYFDEWLTERKKHKPNDDLMMR